MLSGKPVMNLSGTGGISLMPNKFLSGACLAATMLVAFPGPSALHVAKEPKLTPEECVAQHVASIGTAEARAAARSRVAQGNAVSRLLLGGSGRNGGPVAFVSEGQKVRLFIQFNQRDYPGEEFALNGDKVTVGYIRPGVRSPLEAFVLQNDEPLVEGLFGGTLSTAWPLLDLKSRRTKLEYEGLKKTHGRELHKVSYHPRKGSGNLRVELYFEPETFRHVLTVYERTFTAGMTTDPRTASNLQMNRQTLEEEFSDFQTVDSLMLPMHWKVTLSQETNRQGTSLFQFEMSLNRVRHNVPLEPNVFEIR